MSAHFLIKYIVLSPKEPQAYEQTVSNNWLEKFKEEHKVTPSKQEIKELCNYHRITEKIENNIKLITKKFELKDTLEKILTEATKYEEYFQEASKETGLDKNFIKAYMTAESGCTYFSPNAKSNKGAIGVAQMKLTAAKESGSIRVIRSKSGEILYDERRDPRKAIIGSAKYLKKYVDFYEDPIIAVASYNLGPGNLDSLLKEKRTDIFTILFKNIPETREYTARVITRTKILQEPEKYGLSIGHKQSYEKERRAADEYVTQKDESIYKIFPKPSKQELNKIKYLNPAILNLEQIPEGIIVYLPERIYEAKKVRHVK